MLTICKSVNYILKRPRFNLFIIHEVSAIESYILGDNLLSLKLGISNMDCFTIILHIEDVDCRHFA